MLLVADPGQPCLPAGLAGRLRPRNSLQRDAQLARGGHAGVVNKHGGNAGRPRRGVVGWRSWLVVGSFGLLADAAVNVFSADLGRQGVVLASVVIAILAAANWIHSLPPRSPLARYSARTLLSSAFIVAVLTLVIPYALRGAATVVAAGLVAGAVLIPADPTDAVTLLGGGALLGFGVSAIDAGVTVLRGGNAMGGIAIIGFATAIIVTGLAILRTQDARPYVQLAGVGVAIVVFGVAELRGGDVMGGAAIIGIGMAVVVIPGSAVSPGYGDAVGGAASIGAGAVIMAFGAAILRNQSHRDALLGAAIIGLGVMVIAGGVGFLRHRTASGGLTIAGSGAAVVTLGLAILRYPAGLLGAAIIGFGTALVGGGLIELHRDGTLGRARSWLVGLTRESQPRRDEDETAASAREDS
jgi:hypothetical protein